MDLQLIEAREELNAALADLTAAKTAIDDAQPGTTSTSRPTRSPQACRCSSWRA
jgi:hypothetical protein